MTGEERKRPQTAGPAPPCLAFWPDHGEGGPGSNYKAAEARLRKPRLSRAAGEREQVPGVSAALLDLPPPGREGGFWREGRLLRDFAAGPPTGLGLSGPLRFLQKFLHPAGWWRKGRAAVGVWPGGDEEERTHVHGPLLPPRRGARDAHFPEPQFPHSPLL